MDQSQSAAVSFAGMGRIPCVAAASVLPFIDFFDEVGAPARTWMAMSGMPEGQLERPNGILPLVACYRLLDRALREEPLSDLAIAVATRSSVFQMGYLGHRLSTSATIHDYLDMGTRLVGSHSNSGSRMWLTEEGDHVRVHHWVASGVGMAPGLVDVYTLALTLTTLKSLLARQSLAGELRLRRGAENFIGDWDPPVKGPVICGQDHSSFTLPRALLAVRIQPLAEAASAQAPAQAAASDQLPDSFISSVERLILAQLEDGMSQIELLAAACGISVRGMQRRLAEAGTSYRGMLSRVRHARARHWLEATDRPLSDIAEDLGYTDASNFARAFRRESGLSPSEFRRFSARQ